MPPSNTLQFVIKTHVRLGHFIKAMGITDEQSLEKWVIKGLEKDS
jgi:hypothetical protein